MTVKELIEVLQPMNPDAVVMIGDGDKWGEGFAVRFWVSEESGPKGQGKRVVIRDSTA